MIYMLKMIIIYIVPWYTVETHNETPHTLRILIQWCKHVELFGLFYKLVIIKNIY